MSLCDDDLSFYANFLHMANGLAWFSQVRDVAAAEASFFEGSGTLADCAPFGIASNQIVVQYQAPQTLPTAPTHLADKAALFPFSIKLKTGAKPLPELAVAMASTAQTNVSFFSTHPYYGAIGGGPRTGPFWSIRPQETSVTDESSYLSLGGIVRGLMKPKG